MKIALAAVMLLMAVGGALALPTPPDACQTQILINEVIILLILAIILAILGKVVVSTIGVPDSIIGVVLTLIGLAVGLIIIFGYIVGGMSPCTPLPS